MSPDFINGLATDIDDTFFLIAAAIFLIELAEALFKGTLKGMKILEMIASASTQIPYLLVEAFLLTGAYVALAIFAYTSIPWMMEITWMSAVLAVLVADFIYYWEHRIAHRVRILWTQHAVHHSSLSARASDHLPVWAKAILA